jgi:hypothetical protein
MDYARFNQISENILEAMTTTAKSFRKNPHPSGIGSLISMGKRIAEKWSSMAAESDDPYHHEMAHKSHKAVAEHYRTLSQLARTKGLSHIANAAHGRAHKHELRATEHLNAKGSRA